MYLLLTRSAICSPKFPLTKYENSFLSNNSEMIYMHLRFAKLNIKTDIYIYSYSAKGKKIVPIWVWFGRIQILYSVFEIVIIVFPDLPKIIVFLEFQPTVSQSFKMCITLSNMYFYSRWLKKIFFRSQKVKFIDIDGEKEKVTICY